jgi:hypothetical protein
MTPLQLATTRFERDDSGEDSYQITKTLLEAGANPNQLISISMSRLNYNQSKQVYKLLLKEGSKPHFANCTWFNPWIWALEFKDDDFLATLHQFHPDCFSDGSHPFACLQGGWLHSIEFSWWFKLFNYRARCTSNPEQLRQGLELVLQNINLDRHWPTRVKQMIAVLVQEGVDVTQNNSDDQPWLSIVSREIKKWLIYHGQQGPHANLKAVLNSGRALGQIAGLLMQAGANADHLPDPLAVEFVSILQNKETPSSITPEQAKAFLRKSANLCFKLK